MKIKKPNFWNKKGLISFALLPITLLYIIFLKIKKFLTKEVEFKSKIICVGNLYLGGTGKTPLSLFIANLLNNSKGKTFIAKKFYQNHLDEINLIKNNFKNVVVASSRIKCIQQIENSGSEIVVMDDGFQDWTIKKDLSLLCFSSLDGFGNGYVLPAGPLREMPHKTQNAQIIVIKGNKNINLEKKINKIYNNSNIFYMNYEPINISAFQKDNYLAFAGIGNSIEFFETLEKYGVNVKEKLAFSDHYNYLQKDLDKIKNLAQSNNLKIVTTEKDFLRISQKNLEKIDFLKIKVKIDNQVEFEKKIKSFLS